jgi:S-methylmethionine-dependent homocysteine/selenocysteine methylase
MKYRNHLPQLDGGLFLTDGGIETSLIFDDGFDLPHFAAFHLLREDRGREGLRRYYERFLPIAISDGTGFLLESPTWRASKDWGEKLGYSSNEIWEANKDAIGLMMELREAHETSTTPIVISGCVGPRGDGYDPGQIMSAREAETYHAHQIQALGEAGVDMITAITMTNSSEAIGVTRAAQKAGLDDRVP